MAAGQEAVSFNEIIQAGRLKKKNEDLANRILGKKRRASAPGSGAGNKAQIATPGSLASRIGVTKRSVSANLGPKRGSRAPTAPGRAATSNTKATQKRRPDEERLISALNPASGQATIRNNKGGLSIKGAGSGPPVVIGSNFAPGTTAADIQSALEPVSGRILSCWITEQQPTVTVEITFANKSSAEKAIANFHNQRADGRVLSLRLKSAAGGPNPNRDLFDHSTAATSSFQNSSSPFNNQREQADRERRTQRTADPTVQDGSYGFNEQTNQPTTPRDLRNSGRGRGRGGNRGSRNSNRGGRTLNPGGNENGLYSDEMMTDAPPQNSRNRGKR